MHVCRELVVAFVDCVRCYSIVEGLLVDGDELRHEFGPANPGAAGATTTTAPQPTAAALAAAAAGAAGERGGRRGAGAGAGVLPGEPAGVPLDHCSLVKYSPTGAFIAAAGGPGGRHIYVFRCVRGPVRVCVSNGRRPAAAFHILLWGAPKRHVHLAMQESCLAVIPAPAFLPHP